MNTVSKTIVKQDWIIKIFVLLLVLGMILFWVWRISFDRTGDIMADLAEYDGKTVYLLGAAKARVDKDKMDFIEKAGPVIEEKERGGLLSSLEMIWKRH